MPARAAAASARAHAVWSIDKVTLRVAIPSIVPVGGRRLNVERGAFWRFSRVAAEVTHVRTGDHLVLGLGSPFFALVTSGVGQT